MTTDVAQVLGTNLRRIRRELGLTQAVFAERLNLDQSTLSLYESGHRVPRLQNLVERLEAAGIDAAMLFAVEARQEDADPNIARTVAALRRLPPEVRQGVADLAERLETVIPRDLGSEAAQLVELLQALDATQRAGVVAGLKQLVGHLSGSNHR